MEMENDMIFMHVDNPDGKYSVEVSREMLKKKTKNHKLHIIFFLC